jgi:leucyl-tRNA synthetase
VPPAKWTYDNIAHMKQQLKSLGFGLDWSRELTTCRPEYYRWNQWLFLRMLEKGIAYLKDRPGQLGSGRQTVLANEQVIDGRGWRTGALVEKREIPMYYLKITDYAGICSTRSATCRAGPSACARCRPTGSARARASISLSLRDRRDQRPHARVHDARRHDHGRELLRGGRGASARDDRGAANPALAAFIEECKQGPAIEAALATQEKKGMPTGLVVRHPLSGAAVPVWVGNYVLMSYGEGAVMGVPAHDERDFEFAKNMDCRSCRSSMSTGAAIRPTPGSRGTRARPLRQFGVSTTASNSRQRSMHRGGPRAFGPGATSRRPGAARLGHLAAALLGLSDPHDSLRRLRRRAGARRGSAGVLPEDLVPDGSGNPLAKNAAFLDCPARACGGTGAARDRHHGYLRGFVVVFPALCLQRQ